MELEWKPLSFTSKFEFPVLHEVADLKKFNHPTRPTYSEVQKNLNFILKLWWRKIVLPPSSYRFGARCFLTSTTRGNTQRSTFSAAKKTFLVLSKIGWKDDGERFSTPANPQMKPYIQTIPKVDWFPQQKQQSEQIRYSEKKILTDYTSRTLRKTKFSVQNFFFLSFPFFADFNFRAKKILGVWQCSKHYFASVCIL